MKKLLMTTFVVLALGSSYCYGDVIRSGNTFIQINDYQFSQLVELINCCSSFSKIKLKVNWLDECDATIAAEVTISDPEIDELNEELDKLLNK